MTLIARDPRSLTEVHQAIRALFAQQGHPAGTSAEEYFCRSVYPEFSVELGLCDEQTIPVGESKFGGLPDVLPEWNWPLASDGQPLRFLCQLRLDKLEIERISDVLPMTGLLSFFWSFQAEEAVVKYTEEINSLRRYARNDGENENMYFYSCRSMTIAQSYRLIDKSMANGLDKKYLPLVFDIYEDVNQIINRKFNLFSFFGALDFTVAATYENPNYDPQNPWLTLLYIHDPWMIGDDVYEDTDDSHSFIPEFIIKRDDLIQHNFSAAWLSMDVQG